MKQEVSGSTTSERKSFRLFFFMGDINRAVFKLVDFP